MAYTLYNKSNCRPLKHPDIGVWNTPDLYEAEELLRACYEYLDSLNLAHMKADIFIKEINDVSEVDPGALSI